MQGCGIMCMFGFTNMKDDSKQNQYNEIYSINTKEKDIEDNSNDKFTPEKMEQKS